MSDDRREPPTGDDDDRTRGLPPGDESDATRRISPEGADVTWLFSSDDETRRIPPAGDPPPAPTGGGDRVGPPPPDRVGQPPPPADRTAPLPATESTRAQDRVPGETSGPAVWSGRAGVPPPRPGDYQEPEWYGEEPAGRRWWTPILLGVVGLLVAALVAVGAWFVGRSVEGPEETPTPPPTVAPTSAAPTSATPSATPATTPATTAATSAAPTTPPVDEVPMPPLVGLAEATARALLDRLGVAYRVEYRESAESPGTVVATDPSPGEPVPTGQEVTVVVAAAPESPTPTVTPTGPQVPPIP